MFKKLLVPLDRSAVAERALDAARAIARASHASVDIILVHRPDEHMDVGINRKVDARRLADEEQYAAEIATEVAGDASGPTTHAVLTGDVVASIGKRASDVDADLIVMTSHGRTGVSRAWLGSIADGVIRHANVPVLMIRSGEGRAVVPRELFHTILVPLDGSPEALEVLDVAAAMAECGKSRIALLRIVQPVPLITGDATIGFIYPSLVPDDLATAALVEEARTFLSGVARMLEQKGHTNIVQDVIVAGGVAQGILECAGTRQADLIAMCTHGRGASRLLIGSVADKVVRGSRVPVLLFRPVRARTSESTGKMSRSAVEAPQYTTV